MDDSANKRRRGLGTITPNACNECRQKRAKCDGAKPCGRCTTMGRECIYEVTKRESKEHMRHELERLRGEKLQTDKLLAVLVTKDNAVEVLENLRTGDSIEAVLGKLGISEDKGKDTDYTPPRRPSYPLLGGNQAINPAAHTPRSRSIGSSPLSAVAYSNALTEPLSQSSDDPILWSQHVGWGNEEEAGPSGRQEDTVMHDNEKATSWSTLPREARLSETIGKWHLQSDSPASMVEAMRVHGKQNILGNPIEIGGHGPATLEPWTVVTSDNALIEHLMALYFCWEYPTFAPLSKEHFLEDYRAGYRRHCSSLLVNAMLAVGCRFSTQAVTRINPEDSNTSGDHFFAQAVKLLGEQDDRHSLTTIQALGLMSVREASCGRSSEAIYYSGQSMRLASEMGLHDFVRSGDEVSDSDDQTVRSATFWGAFAMDQCWSMSTGRLPVLSLATRFIPTPFIVEHIEASPWIPYTDDGTPMEHSLIQPSNVRSVYKTFCELSEIVHRYLYLCYTPGAQLTSSSLLGIYGDYLKWYEAIPEALRLGDNFTPAVLFCHMYYHYAILLLFRPFIKLELIGSGVSPRDVCFQAADAISALVSSYDQLYTLHRTPSFVPYFVLTSSITHLVTHGMNRKGPEQLHQGIADLKVMEDCHGFATRARNILYFLAVHWEVIVSWKDDTTSPEEKKGLCRPRRGSLNQFVPNLDSVSLKSNFRVLAKNLSGEDDDEGDQEALIKDLLFSPFPLQGQPLLRILRGAGFRSLAPDVV